MFTIEHVGHLEGDGQVFKFPDGTLFTEAMLMDAPVSYTATIPGRGSSHLHVSVTMTDNPYNVPHFEKPDVRY